MGSVMQIRRQKVAQSIAFAHIHLQNFYAKLMTSRPSHLGAEDKEGIPAVRKIEEQRDLQSRLDRHGAADVQPLIGKVDHTPVAHDQVFMLGLPRIHQPEIDR